MANALLRSASLASIAWRVALLMARRSATERRRPPLVVLAVSPATALKAVLKAWAAFLPGTEGGKECDDTIIGGSLEVKLPTICRDGKAGGKSQRGEVKK